MYHMRFFLQEQMNEKFTQKSAKTNAFKFLSVYQKKIYHSCGNSLKRETLNIDYEQKTNLPTPNVKTNTIGANSFISRGTHLCNTPPDDIKNMTSIAISEWG